MSGLATIQFSNPIPRRRYFEQKPPLETKRSPVNRRVYVSPRSNSLQFGEARIRQGSAQRSIECDIEEEQRRFQKEMLRLTEENEQLEQQLRLLQSYNESLNIRNILELERIVYLQDRITQEEDWHRQRVTDGGIINRL